MHTLSVLPAAGGNSAPVALRSRRRRQPADEEGHQRVAAGLIPSGKSEGETTCAVLQTSPCLLWSTLQSILFSLVAHSTRKGLISRVTAYWKLHYADQRPRKELAEACMEIITRERDLWSPDGVAGDALDSTTPHTIFEHFTEHLTESGDATCTEDRILADLAHNAVALQSLTYGRGDIGLHRSSYNAG